MTIVQRLTTGLLAITFVAAGLAPVAAQAPQGAQGAQGAQGRGRGPATPPLIMTTTAFEDGGVIPDKYTQAAGPMAVSPALSWSQVPMGTQSFVLLFHDPEPVLNKGSKMDITHWLIWNIPGTSTGLPEGVAQGELPDGSRQVSLRSNSYMGPGAPPGPYHHYTFELYALDIKARCSTRHAAAGGGHARRGLQRDGWPRAREGRPRRTLPSAVI